MQLILDTYRRATAAELESGVEWYGLAHSIARDIAPSIEVGAGVISALSPRVVWDRNVTLAREALAGTLTNGALFKNIAKANAIVAGADPLTVLGGNKTRAFYANIVDPFGDDVTIDRHAFDIAVGRVTNDKDRAVLGRKGVYESYADQYREAGAHVGMSGAQLQAVTWVAWRRMKGIK